MTTENQSNIKNAARDTVEESDNIQNSIQHIVVHALKDGKMDAEAIKKTLNDVVEGAFEGIKVNKHENTEKLKDVVKGVDSALSQVAEASKLAIEEASSNIKDFSDHDLKRAMNDLQDLEKLFFSTLNEIADQSKDTANGTLKTLMNHFQSNGSTVGKAVNEISDSLHDFLSKNGRLNKVQAADVARTTGATIARISSGILAGIAESLQPKEK